MVARSATLGRIVLYGTTGYVGWLTAREMVAQKLLDGGHTAATIAIDPGQIKGVRPVPFAQIRSGLPVLSNPSNKRKSVSLTRKQFRYGFYFSKASPAAARTIPFPKRSPGPYKLYAGSTATTDYRSFADRGHSLVFDHGWREIVDFTVDWLKCQGL
ncbi:hypothetical protein AB0J74_38090 [Asanoa sp. NPDC049573]|uniref:hypothetical protein n=1 Tax=Asanoa sp. NPDC049573 TaxID=3155396 RepID=UPI0034247DED